MLEQINADVRAELLRRLRGLSWSCLGVAEPKPPAGPQPGLTIGGVLEVYDELRARTPTVTEFWCVDRPHAYWRLYEECMRQRAVLAHDPGGPVGLWGIPILEWYSHLPEQPDDRRPPFADQPGVYAVLSNGDYKKIGD